VETALALTDANTLPFVVGYEKKKKALHTSLNMVLSEHLLRKRVFITQQGLFGRRQ